MSIDFALAQALPQLWLSSQPNSFPFHLELLPSLLVLVPLFLFPCVMPQLMPKALSLLLQALPLIQQVLMPKQKHPRSQLQVYFQHPISVFSPLHPFDFAQLPISSLPLPPPLVFCVPYQPAQILR